MQHPVRQVVKLQGRRLTWVAAQLGISGNYLHRLLLPAGHPDRREPPADFYPRLSLLLGVPEDMLRPESKDAIAA